MGRRSDSNFKALRGKPSDFDGNRIGLTEAFAPVRTPDDGQVDGSGNPMGLTEAFSPVDAAKPRHAFTEKPSRAISDDGAPRGKHAKHARVEDVDASSMAFDASVGLAYGDELHDKHKRTRKVLIGSIALIILLIVALVVSVVKLLDEGETLASQQAQEHQSNLEAEALGQGETGDAASASGKQTDVVVLTTLLGLSLDEAIESVGRGATVTSERDVDEEDNPIKKELTLSLTNEPADTRSGTPSVFLSLNEEGKVVRAGYSAATTALGYGSLSFADAVTNERIVERALRDAGLNVDDGVAVLPEDKAEYSTYDSDGVTLKKERCSFSGVGLSNGVEHTWDAVLLYDYVAANTSGNLDDTIRSLYIYINA